jgi:hypothetical protein
MYGIVGIYLKFKMGLSVQLIESQAAIGKQEKAC